MNRDQKLERFIAETERLSDQGQLFQVTFDLMTLQALVAQCNLALRHPENSGPAARLARQAVETIASQIAFVAPESARVMLDGLQQEGKVKA